MGIEVYATHPKTPDWRWLITGDPIIDDEPEYRPVGYDYAKDSIVYELYSKPILYGLKNPTVKFWHQSTLGAGPTHRVIGKKQIAAALTIFWEEIESAFNKQIENQR